MSAEDPLSTRGENRVCHHLAAARLIKSSWSKFVPLSESLESDNLMGPLPVSCGQFPLSPPRRLPGRAETDSHDAATPMDCCSLLLPVSQLAARHMSRPNSRSLPCLWGAWLALESCAPVIWKLLATRFGVCCESHGLSAGSKEWQCSKFKEIQVERFRRNLCSPSFFK